MHVYSVVSSIVSLWAYLQVSVEKTAASVPYPEVCAEIKTYVSWNIQLLPVEYNCTCAKVLMQPSAIQGPKAISVAISEVVSVQWYYQIVGVIRE